MAKKTKQCKTKNCYNPVIDGNYCEYCTQKKKENRNRAAAAGFGLCITAAGFAIKKGALKQIPKMVSTVVKMILKR